MLAKILITTAVLVGIFFLIGFFSHDKEELLKNLKQKGYTPTQSTNTPACDEPLILQTPVDLRKVTSILYPGQERGGDFKAHGGFRFDNSKPEEIEVRAPLDATISDASRYIESGQVQYLFEFESDCKIRYRFDHLLTLSPKLAQIAEKLPEAKEDDSRTTPIATDIKVSKGEVIATAVGYQINNNVFVDFGVYDMKGENIFSRDLRKTALCWFDLLPPEDARKVRSLPAADSKSGSQSIYCK